MNLFSQWEFCHPHLRYTTLTRAHNVGVDSIAGWQLICKEACNRPCCFYVIGMSGVAKLP